MVLHNLKMYDEVEFFFPVFALIMNNYIMASYLYQVKRDSY